MIFQRPPARIARIAGTILLLKRLAFGGNSQLIKLAAFDAARDSQRKRAECRR
jgi:hypothetical protein